MSDKIPKNWKIKQIKKQTYDFSPGDFIRVNIKIFEGGKERIQPFEGVVIRKRGKGINKTFTVRKVSFGIGVEKTFLAYSPVIKKIKIVKKSIVRRSKLYFLREKVGKKAKLKEEKIVSEKPIVNSV